MEPWEFVKDATWNDLCNQIDAALEDQVDVSNMPAGWDRAAAIEAAHDKVEALRAARREREAWLRTQRP